MCPNTSRALIFVLAADSFMSDVEDMMDKAKNGTIDSNDLLKAASVVIAAMLS